MKASARGREKTNRRFICDCQVLIAVLMDWPLAEWQKIFLGKNFNTEQNLKQ